jgi:hypothetical protein
MRAFAAQEILCAWEWGQTHHPLDRALFLLSLAFPEKNWEELAAFSIGQRNRRLLALREQIAGPTLNCFVTCPQCATALEFSVQAADICLVDLDETMAQVYDLSVEGIMLRFRLPNSRDLAAIVPASGVPTARAMLIQRCVQQAARDGVSIALAEVPETVLTALAAQMIELDPQAELRFRPMCEACGHQWSALFDIASFVWTEVAAMAKRLLQEVHTLALAYGWREADILAMETIRRQFYLQMVGA